MDPAKLLLDETAKVPLQNRDPNRRPARIAILGNVHLHRRNYQGMIDELHDAISGERARGASADSTDDPEAWGYRASIAAGGRFVATDDPARPPISLHLVGSKPSNTILRIPPEMEHLVEIHSDLEYTDFYRLIASM